MTILSKEFLQNRYNLVDLQEPVPFKIGEENISKDKFVES
jgi:hypothetical protein